MEKMREREQANSHNYKQSIKIGKEKKEKPISLV